MIKPLIDAGELVPVGGWVRDRLLGRESRDLDLVVVGRNRYLEALGRLEGLLGIRAETTPLMTGRFRLEDGEISLAMARRERYPRPGSPRVEPADTLEEDLARRDFTANAMALVRGRLVDPFGGREHLARGLLVPLAPWRDDPTRAIRAARYSALLGLRLGDLSQLADARELMPRVPFQRVKKELARSLFPEAIGLMARWRLFGRGDPGKLPELGVSHWTVVWGVLGSWIPEEGITRDERRALRIIFKHRDKGFKSIGEVHRALRGAPEPAVLALAALHPLAFEYLKKRERLRDMPTAEELIAAGVRREKLARVRLRLEVMMLTGEIRTREEALSAARRLSR